MIFRKLSKLYYIGSLIKIYFNDFFLIFANTGHTMTKLFSSSISLLLQKYNIAHFCGETTCSITNLFDDIYWTCKSTRNAFLYSHLRNLFCREICFALCNQPLICNLNFNCPILFSITIHVVSSENTKQNNNIIVLTLLDIYYIIIIILFNICYIVITCKTYMYIE
jgi:hypothetical protein